VGFGTEYDMGIYQKLFILTIVALKCCPSLKLVSGQLVWSNSSHTKKSSRNQKGCNDFEAGFPEYQPEIIFLDPFDEQKHLCYKPLVKLQHSPGVTWLILATVWNHLNLVTTADKTWANNAAILWHVQHIRTYFGNVALPQAFTVLAYAVWI